MDLAPPRAQVSDHISGGLFRNGHLDAHDGLQDNGSRLLKALLEGYGSRAVEGRLVRLVHRESPIHKAHADAHQRVPSQNASCEAVPHGGLDSSSHFSGHDLRGHQVLVLQILTARERPQFQHHSGGLYFAATLPYIVLLGGDRPCDRLAIGYLWLADADADMELPAQPLHQHVEVQFAHPGDDPLTGVLVGPHPKCGILFRQGCQRGFEPWLVGGRTRLDRQLDYRFGEANRLQNDRVITVAQRVAGERELEAANGCDVAGADALRIFAMVRVHVEQASDAFLALLGEIRDRGVGLERARVDAQVGKPSDEGIAHHLEHEGGQRLVRIRAPQDRPAGLRVKPFDRWHVQGGGKVVYDRVQNRLYAPIAQCRPAEHRNEPPRQGGSPQSAAQLVRTQLVAFEVLGKQDVVRLCDGLDQVLACPGHRVVKVLGQCHPLRVGPQFVLPDQSHVVDQIDNALKRSLGSDRHLYRHRYSFQALPDRSNRTPEVGSRSIHLVNEADPRHMEAICLPPYGLGLRLDTLNRVEHHDPTIQHAQTALHLGGKVDVPGRVNDVNAVPIPEGGHRRRYDGDAPLALLVHPVGDGCALIDIP